MKGRSLVWAPPVIALGFFAMASLVIAIYYGNTKGISYPTPVTIEILWHNRGGITVSSIREAWWQGPYDVAFIATVIAWPLLTSSSSRRAQLLAAVLPLVLLCPMNILGVLDAFVGLATWQSWDGETLAEGWPLIDVYGLWALWAALFLMHRWRQRGAPPQRQAIAGAA